MRRVILTCCLSHLVTGFLPGTACAQAEPARLTVAVTDRADGRPLADVDVRVTTAGVTMRTNGEGRTVTAPLTPRQHILLVQRLGYAPESVIIEFTPGADVLAEIPLRTLVVNLESVEVRAERTNARLARSGFYERQRKNAAGTFIGEEEIARRREAGAKVTDLIRNARGITVEHVGGMPVVYSTRGADSILLGRCRPQLYIDGHLFRIPLDDQGRPMLSLDQVVVTEEIAAIEVYASGISAPFGLGGGGGCGSVAIWTRSG